MTDTDQFSDQIDPIMELMRSKLGIRARSFPAALARAGRRLPRPIRREGQVLAEALALALPDYPRGDEEVIGEQVFTEPGKEAMTDEDAKPFAGLAALRDKLTGEGGDD